MKRSANVILYLAIPALSTMSGCLDVNVRTTVSSDGSSVRVVSMKLDSRNVPESAFPVTADSTWRVEWKETGDKEGKFEYIATKKFGSPDDLQREYSPRPDTGAIGLNVSLHKRFEWFYTYFEYREAYTRHNIFNNVPVSDYLSQDEINRYLHGEESDSLKAKVKMWDDRNLFEEFFRPLLAEARHRNDPALSPALLLEKKNEMFLRVMAAEDEYKGGGNKKTDSTKHDATIDVALRTLADVLHTRAILSLRPVADQAWASIVEKLDKDKHPDTWTCSLQMPGLLMSTNSDQVDGNLVSWKFTADQIRVGEYVMQASSRTTNVWAFVVTGTAALLVILMAILALLRRRTMASARQAPSGV